VNKVFLDGALRDLAKVVLEDVGDTMEELDNEQWLHFSMFA